MGWGEGEPTYDKRQTGLELRAKALWSMMLVWSAPLNSVWGGGGEGGNTPHS